MEVGSAYEFSGYVTKVQQFVYGEPSVFFLSDQTGKEYRVVCPFFCPVDINDVVFSLVEVSSTIGQLVCLSQPFVQVPVHEDAIKLCFIKALRGTGFGGLAANDLYTKIAGLVRNARLVKERMMARIKAAEIKKNDDLKLSSLLPALPSVKVEEKKVEEKKMEEKKEKVEEKRPFLILPTVEVKKKEDIQLEATMNGQDGVIAYLTDSAYQYSKTYSNSIINAIVNGTKLKGEQVSKLLIWWHKHRTIRRLHLFGLNNKEIKGCMKPPDEIYQICMANPYRLPAIPIEKAETIMKSMKKIPTPLEILCGQIVRKIYECLERSAWTATPIFILKKQFPTFNSIMQTLIDEYEVIFEHNMAYLAYPHRVETFVAEDLNQRIKRTAERLRDLPKVDTPKIESAMYSCKTLTDEQKLAIQGALQHDICIITGCSGTGKSTIISEIVKNLQAREIPFAVTAFTGKAVSRVQEIMQSRGIAATTDRMIVRSTGVTDFKVLIVDETSMKTTELYYRFRKAYPGEYKLILTGDNNQLQPISWGSLFEHILMCGRVPTYRLTLNHRLEMAAGERGKVDDLVILQNASRLIDPRRDLAYPMSFTQGAGFYQCEGGVEIVHAIVKQLHDTGVPEKDITIICPYNEYLDQLNSSFQQIYLSDTKKFIDSKKKLWCVGDRVMMLVNNYEINVMNGETGYVRDLNEKGVTVQFADGADHIFKYEDPSKGYRSSYTKKGEAVGGGDGGLSEDRDLSTANLKHAFAVTVHKIQGSQNKWIGVFIPHKYNKFGTQSNFLNINLLYTAITRTEKACWLIGSEAVIGQATTRKPSRRFENLCLRLNLLREAEVDTIIERHQPKPVESKEQEPINDASEPMHEDMSMYENV